MPHKLTLGISLGHDCAAAVLEGPDVLAAVQEERITRVKYHAGFPLRAVRRVLCMCDISVDEIDTVAVGFNKGYLFETSFTHEEIVEKLKSCGIYARVRYYDHHHCHAASVAYTCPYERAAVFTSDGKGGGQSATAYLWENKKLHKTCYVEDIHSIGAFFLSVTSHCGFRPNRHEGKVMALAAAGTGKNIGCGECFRIDERTGKPINIMNQNYDELSVVNRAYRCGELHNNFMGRYFKFNLHSDKREDIAQYGQDLLERTTLRWIARYMPEGVNNICLAGGVFANVRLNQRIRESRGVDGVYIFPAMGDAGTAIGAAYIANGIPNPITTVNWGDNFGDITVPPEKIAAEIARGKIVGYFHGAMEFGPRALGHRSILCSANDDNINKELNRRLARNDFMPFAPSIAAEYAGKYLEGYRDDCAAGRFMTMNYTVKERVRDKIPAVIHLDGTVRPHVVHREDNPHFHKVIMEYYKLTGIPIIINTSFNCHEEPIVRTPEEASVMLENDVIDVLAIGGRILKKDKAPSVARYVTQATRRIHSIAIDSYRYVKSKVELADDAIILLAFMRYCPKLVDYFVYVRLLAQAACEVPEKERRSLLRWIAIIDSMYEDDSIENALDIITGNFLEQAKDIVKICGGWTGRYTYNGSADIELLRKFRGKWKLTEYNYDDSYEIPACIGNSQCGEEDYYDGQDISELGAMELSKVACTRLWRLYMRMITQIEPIVSDQIEIMDYQKYFDDSRDMINTAIGKGMTQCLR